MRPKLRLIDEQKRAELKAACLDKQNGIEAQRLQTIKLAYSGHHTMAEIAELVGRGRRSVARWVKAFRQEGVAGLRSKPRGGLRQKRVIVDEPTGEALLEGLKVGRWKRARDIQRWLQTEKKAKLSLPGLYNWLRRHKAKPKVPRKSHAKKDPVKTAKFKITMADQLKALGVPAGSKVRLWVADEHRYGLISVLRRVWSLRGYKPTAPYQTKYQWGYLYSALEIGGDARAEALFLPTVNLDCSQIFLEQIAATDAQAEHVVIWDQAGFHQSTGPTPVPRVRILSLPPYSPELNPVEKLGILIKGAIGNIIFPSLQKLEDKICEELKPIWTEPARVRQLIGDGWMLSEANASSNRFSASL